MVKNSTKSKNRYDKIHMKQFLLKLHLVNDADIIEKFSSVPNMQGYIKQLVREDLARTPSGSEPENNIGGIAMNNAFYERVVREQIVDTKQYRYIAKVCCDADNQWTEIRRLPIKSLDTTDAIDGWETIKIIRT